jgi:predicted metal-dependent phosphoesterase TrpH
MIKLDLHTHSIASADGGINAGEYIKAIESKLIDIVAITDHNRIDFALNIQKKYPKNIIVGEEIMTSEGEIIGLFLSKSIKPHMSLEQTITEIKTQGGLCYIPHPIEKLRKGLSWDCLNKIKDNIDILEVGNGRALNKRNHERLMEWASANKIRTASSSDAHGRKGLGRTYTMLGAAPTGPENLLKNLDSSELIIKYPSLIEILYPKYNRIYNKR